MPKRFENGYFALVLTCALALLTIAYVSFFVAFSKGYQSADQEHTTYNAQRDTAEIVYRECLDASFSIDIARQCVEKADYTTRESERAEQDLNAQREMAQWSEGMLWAAWLVGIATVSVTAVGVFFVKRTLEQAGETNRAAIDAAKAANDANVIMRDEQRAWVIVDLKPDQSISHEPNSKTAKTISMIIQPNLENVGNTPAINMGISCRMKIIPQGDKTGVSAQDYTDLIQDVISSAQASTSRGQLTETLFQGRPATLWRNGIYAHARLSDLSEHDLSNSVVAVCFAVCYKIPSGFGFAVTHGVLFDQEISGIYTNIVERAMKAPVRVRVIWNPTSYT